MDIQLHLTPWYEKRNFALNQVHPIKNHLHKPEGGLWTSSYNQKIGSEWLQSDFVELKSGCRGTLLQVVGNPNILSIKTVEQAKKVASTYFLGQVLTLNCYDYEKMTEYYDGIRIYGEALHEGSPFWEFNLESTLWFNVNHLRVLEKIVVLKYKS